MGVTPNQSKRKDEDLVEKKIWMQKNLKKLTKKLSRKSIQLRKKMLKNRKTSRKKVIRNTKISRKRTPAGFQNTLTLMTMQSLIPKLLMRTQLRKAPDMMRTGIRRKGRNRRDASTTPAAPSCT